MATYPSWEAVRKLSEGANLGLQIVFDTYTRQLHEKCRDVCMKVLAGNYINPTTEEQTCEVYVEIVLSLKGEWAGFLHDFRAARAAARTSLPMATLV